MWETRTIDYFTEQPQESWHTVDEAFVKRNINRKPEGYTKTELLDWLRNHPSRVYNTGFREYRYRIEKGASDGYQASKV